MDEFLQSLTPREREVYQLRISGYSIKETSRKMGVSTRTVEVFLSHITEKAALHDLIWSKALIKKPQ